MSECERCGTQTTTTTMSRFNTETICMSCEEREKKHPLYKKAQEAELKAVQQGNFNFPGIGKPADL
jgi:recombinational DNA repair protein (RecF pathway)